MSNRLAVQPSLHQFLEARTLLLGRLLIKARVQGRPRAAQRMSQQQLSLQPGRLVALAGEVARRPVEKRSDGPALILAHDTPSDCRFQIADCRLNYFRSRDYRSDGHPPLPICNL